MRFNGERMGGDMGRTGEIVSGQVADFFKVILLDVSSEAPVKESACKTQRLPHHNPCGACAIEKA